MQHLKWSLLTGPCCKRTCKKKGARDDRNEHPQLRWKSTSYWNHICLSRIQNLQCIKWDAEPKRHTHATKARNFPLKLSAVNFPVKGCRRRGSTVQSRRYLWPAPACKKKHTNISGFIADNWISICYIGHQGECTQMTIETQNSPNTKVKFKSYFIQ